MAHQVWAVVAAAALAFACSCVGTLYVRKTSLVAGLLDMPNARSSHTAPTPRGGGLAIALATSVAFGVLALAGVIRWPLLWALIGGGGVVALAGFADDHRPIAPGVRLVAHLLAALWAVFWLGGLPSITVNQQVIHLGWGGNFLAVLAVIWTINLFNFMDGIDGIAASEAIFIAAAGALLSPGADGLASAAWVFAASCCGFLLWNWPPAKIFMGDVGSGYLGYVLAVLGLNAAPADIAAPWVWLILGAVFLVDATVTLVRRALRGERVYQAHRSHAYQWLARRWRSHRPVTLAVLGVNLLWVAPWAALARARPTTAAWIALMALLPLAAVALVAGAGRGEEAL